MLEKGLHPLDRYCQHQNVAAGGLVQVFNFDARRQSLNGYAFGIVHSRREVRRDMFGRKSTKCAKAENRKSPRQLKSPLWAAGVPPVNIGHRLHHLAHGAATEGAVDQGWHHVGRVQAAAGDERRELGVHERLRLALAGLADVLEGALHLGGVAGLLELGEAVALVGFDVVADLEDIDGAVAALFVVGVDADDDAVAGFALLGEAVGRLGDLAAEVAAVGYTILSLYLLLQPSCSTGFPSELS